MDQHKATVRTLQLIYGFKKDISSRTPRFFTRGENEIHLSNNALCELLAKLTALTHLLELLFFLKSHLERLNDEIPRGLLERPQEVLIHNMACRRNGVIRVGGVGVATHTKKELRNIFLLKFSRKRKNK